MFQYFLAFLLINSYYQSLGIPLPPNLLISDSLTVLANQCENTYLSTVIKSKIKDCLVSVPPYNKKQIRCLIFYDINKQLCSAVAASKIALTAEHGPKLSVKQDVNTVCTLARDWVFTNISDYSEYKNSTENLFKLPATCGEICGVEDTMNEANDFCKYYRWGIETLKGQVITTGVNANNNAVEPVIPEPDSNPKADIAVPINGNMNPQIGNTRSVNVQLKQTESAITKTTAEKTEKTEETGDVAIPKSTVQVTSKQSVNPNVPTSDKRNDIDVKPETLEHPMDMPDVETHEQANKSTVSNESKPGVENDPAVLPESGKDLPINMDPKEVVLEKTEAKAPSDPDDYADPDGNEPDDDTEDQGMDIKLAPDTKQDSFIRTKLMPSHNGDMSQKEYYPNPMTDTFSDDGDHFFPFFLTGIILVVLLYVLYHNKNKVGKVFFGLILEGRQGSRRRNSRGHAYRRLDTLEQAMSATTAAPPSKIIY